MNRVLLRSLVRGLTVPLAFSVLISTGCDWESSSHPTGAKVGAAGKSDVASSTFGESGPQAITSPVITNLKTEDVEIPEAALRIARLKKAQYSRARKQSSFFAQNVAPVTVEPAISGEVTMTKSSVLNRTFLYGSDLQYSSVEMGSGMYVQAIALGHIPARFTILGDRLQLVAEQSHLFESDINKPGRLIHELPIVRQDDETITVTVRQASPILATVLGGKNPQPFRSSWVRSIEFVKEGNYLLVETSVEQADGSVAEFMESVFPRETLVPADAKPLLANGEHEPLAQRYRFLAGEPLFMNLPMGRTKTLVASRFPINAKLGMIDWYVTPNIPEQFLPAVQAGIEGWNRYSRQMWGRDFVRFAGVLPEGVKIGDPRYNIISWDSVPNATSAYESQASDPLSGLQSHSLIYLPYAWYKIGQEYWKNSALTQHDDETAQELKALLDSGDYLGQKIRLGCLHEIEQTISLQARRTPEAFADELLRQVLLHEVGHALGLAHNFKGSLTFDPEDPSTLFTSTIMDYNQYQLEDATFVGTSSEGPLFEYDRQILSVLYNDAQDVKDSDPVLPVCNDEEADSTTGGVDPLCLRYDAGKDPSQQLVRTLQLISDPTSKLGRTQSLVAAIEETHEVLGKVSEVTTEEEAGKRIKALTDQLGGVTAFYYTAGAQSLRYMLRANLRSLYMFRAGVDLTGIDEAAMRTRVANSLKLVSSMAKLSDTTQTAFSKTADYAEVWLKSTPWYNGLADDQKDVAVAKLLQPVRTLPMLVEAIVLPRLRTATFSVLVRDANAPFFFVNSDQGTTDFEKMSLDILEEAVSMPLLGEPRTMEERVAAATALKTFSGLKEGAEAIERATSRVRAELPTARSMKDREALRGLLKVLEG